MNLKLIDHARERAIQRGTTEEEIVKVITDGKEVQAKQDRKAKEKVFTYGKEWLGEYYPHKKVVAIYKEENGDIIVITVKVFYGKWEG